MNKQGWLVGESTHQWFEQMAFCSATISFYQIY